MSETQDAAEKSSINNVGGSYPSETLNYCLEICKQIYEAKGDSFVSTTEICAITGKAKGTMIMKISACVQYGLLLNTYGKGYSITELFISIIKPEFEHAERNKRLEAINNPALYKKLIERYNGKSLPSNLGLSNILTEYNIHNNSTAKSASVFLENCAELNIIENGRLRYFIPNSSESSSVKKKEEESNLDNVEKKPPFNPRREDENAENETVIIIPLKQGETRARLILPNGFDNKDLKRISKFVSALQDDE
ncbi:MAG: hypothetical protein V4506_02810 [Bacteroidota bacterium]